MIEKRFATKVGVTPKGKMLFEITELGLKEHRYWNKSAPPPERQMVWKPGKDRYVCVARFRDRADADRCRLGLATFFPSLKTSLNPMDVAWPWGVWFDDRQVPAVCFTYGLVLMAGDEKAKMDIDPPKVAG